MEPKEIDLSHLPSNDNIPRIKRGRPKKEVEFDRATYNKNYYQMNKEKYTGDYYCPICGVLCSKANKSTHNKSKRHMKYVNDALELIAKI